MALPPYDINPKLALNWVCFGFATLDIDPKLALIGFELGLFFGIIFVFSRKMRKIGFVLHKKLKISYEFFRRFPAYSGQRLAYKAMFGFEDFMF